MKNDLLTELRRSLFKSFFAAAAAMLAVTVAFAQGSTASVALPANAAAKPTPTPDAKPAPAPAPAPIRVGSLTVSGSLRARFESWDWFETDKAENSYNFGAMTLRVAISQSREKFEWQVEGAAPVFFNLPERSIAPAPQGQLGLGATYFAANGRQNASGVLKQAFVRFKGLFGDEASSLKMGRFEFNDGTEIAPADPTLATVKRDHISQRLIGAFGFTHIGRSFDGLQFGRNAKAGNFTFVAARPTAGVFDLGANKELDVDFYYGAFTKPLKHKSGESEYRLFALHYHDGRRVLKTDNRAQAVRAADFDKVRITTFGGHFIGAYQTGGGKTDVLLWTAGQAGSFGQLDHLAGAIAVEAGYQPGGKLAAKLKPWFRAGYFRSTGDGDPADDRHGTFFQVLPTPRIYARTPFYNLMNNEDAFVQLRLRPHSKVGLRADLHYLRLSSVKDLWYVGGGAFQNQTFGYVGRPSGGRKTLGTFADLSVDYNLAPRTALTAYFGGVKGGGVVSNIYPLGANQRFLYFELTQRF